MKKKKLPFWRFLTKVDVGLRDEPRLVIRIQGESVGHQLFDRHGHSFHIYCLDAVPQISSSSSSSSHLVAVWEIFNISLGE